MSDQYLNYGHQQQQNAYMQVHPQHHQHQMQQQHHQQPPMVVQQVHPHHIQQQQPHQQIHQYQYVMQPQQQQPQQYVQHQPVQQPSQQQYHQQNTYNELTSTSNLHLTLLGLAETFLKANQYRLSIHCLESILTLKTRDLNLTAGLHMQLKTRLNLCRMYLKYTTNTNQYVNVHLEKSMIIAQNLKPDDEYKYEATYNIYKIFQKQKESHNQIKNSSASNVQIDQSQLTSIFSLDLIRSIMETSKAFPVWHVRLLFLIGNILLNEKDYNSAAFYMSIGIEFCIQNRLSSYTHILFILSKGMIHLIQKNTTDLQTTMQPCAALIENYKTNNGYQIECLKIFFLVLQVTYFIQCGQMKSVRNTLKSLQHYVQALATRFDTENEQTVMITPNPLENFYWMHKDHLGILAFLLTVVHTVQTGCFDKAQKFLDKALVNLEKLRLKEQTLNNVPSLYSSNTYITNRFNILLVENQIRCNLAMGNKTAALKQIGEAFQICEKDLKLFNSYLPQLHCLVGLYALATNLRDAAINQFNMSLKLTNDTELWLYCAMNLALCYLPNISVSASNKTQLLSIIENIVPEKIQTQSTNLNAFSNYFKALKFFINNNFQQAQDSLREAMTLANAEDLSNISSNSFIFMGHINLLTNQFQDSFNMLTNGLDLADKMPDSNLRTYATSLLKNLYKYFNDPREAEVTKINAELEQRNSLDQFEASKLPQHALINWNTNNLPSQIMVSINRFKSTLNTPVSISMPSTSNQINPVSTEQTPNYASYQPHQQPSTPTHGKHGHHHVQSPVLVSTNSPQVISIQQQHFNSPSNQQYPTNIVHQQQAQQYHHQYQPGHTAVAYSVQQSQHMPNINQYKHNQY